MLQYSLIFMFLHEKSLSLPGKERENRKISLALHLKQFPVLVILVIAIIWSQRCDLIVFKVDFK